MDDQAQADMKVSDAESVAGTLERNVKVRRDRRRDILLEVDKLRAVIDDHLRSVADLDRVIKVMEKSASKLRKG